MNTDEVPMTEVDRYVTDEAIQAGRDMDIYWSELTLRAALPGILVQHKKDVLQEHTALVEAIVAQAQREARAEALREVADLAEELGDWLDAGRLRRMADEAMSDD